MSSAQLPLESPAPLILVAEDDPDDAFFTRRALELVGVPHRLFLASDGIQTIQYLSGTGPFADRKLYPPPALLLLDLKMPVVDGFAVLRWVQAKAELERLPVIVLTGCLRESELKQALQMGADACMAKPPSPQVLRTVIQERLATALPPFQPTFKSS